MLTALSRRIFIFLAAYLFVGFVLVFLHDLQDNMGFPVSVLTGGALACAIVIAINWIGMARNDDYLTPPHSRAFFIGVAVAGGVIGLGLLAFFYFNRENYAPAFFIYYGLIPAAVGALTVILASVRIKEAYAMPPEYRPDPGSTAFVTGAVAIVSTGIIVGSTGAIVSVMSDPEIWEVREHRWEERADPDELPGDERAEQAEELYRLGMQQKDHYRRSYELFRRSAELGHIDALFELGKIYAGDGYLRDIEKAIETYERAARRGHSEAAFILGRSYRHGENSVTPDPVRAHDYLRQAAMAGNIEAQNQIANLYVRGEGVDPNPETAFYWFRRAAEQGSGTAQNDVGIFLVNGTGVERDVQEGLRWLQMAADQDLPVAQYNLARTLYYGDVSDRDYERAFTYFSKLADRGIALGFRYVGLHHLNGHGVEQDYAKAMTAFLEAARRGDALSEYQAGVGYLKGRGIERDTSAALVLLERAANQANMDAQLLLGNIYRDGEVILRDPVEAAKWYILASENGSDEASEEWEALEKSLSSSELEMLRGSIAAFKAASEPR